MIHLVNYAFLSGLLFKKYGNGLNRGGGRIIRSEINQELGGHQGVLANPEARMEKS